MTHQWKTGKVDWFDEIRGEGALTDNEGNRYSFHHSTITTQNNWKKVEKGQKIYFTIAGGRKRQIVQQIKAVY